MIQWYYAKGGQQHGPVTQEELQSLLRSGALYPATDLVWNQGMADWLPASQVPALNGETYGSHPFAYPTATGAMEEIAIGSEPIIPTACVKRAFDLTVKHVGPILIISLLYFVIAVLAEEGLGWLDRLLGLNPGRNLGALPPDANVWEAFRHGMLSESLSLPMSLVSHLVTVFFLLGLTKIALNAVSGKPFGVGMLFSGGKWLGHGYLGYLVYMLMVFLGFILFIFPGIYIMLRFGMYHNAIVDKNLGFIEALKYSSKLTKDNRMSLFVICLFSIGIMIAGCVAMIVGMLFAFPVIVITWTVAYRWMQYGGRAVLDDPMTGRPLLSSLPD